jgi:ACS family glucarate transporter-like MFS transporter
MDHTTTAATPIAATRLATRTRWTILAILFIVTTINYADRASISIAGPEMRKVFGLSSDQMGFVFSAFSW